MTQECCSVETQHILQIVYGQHTNLYKETTNTEHYCFYPCSMNCLSVVDGQREYFPSEQRQTRLNARLNVLVNESHRRQLNRRQSNSPSQQLSNIMITNQARITPPISNREVASPSVVRIM